MCILWSSVVNHTPVAWLTEDGVMCFTDLLFVVFFLDVNIKLILWILVCCVKIILPWFIILVVSMFCFCFIEKGSCCFCVGSSNSWLCTKREIVLILGKISVISVLLRNHWRRLHTLFRVLYQFLSVFVFFFFFIISTSK